MNNNHKILFVSLGCDKNLVDSEHMMYDLLNAGYEVCAEEAEADVIVINTCCFIADALEESIQTIIDLGEYKKTGNLKALIITGCLAQRFTDDVLADLPEVDAIVGTNATDELIPTINKVLNGDKEVIIKDLTGLPKVNGRVVSTGASYAYLKIAEGCNKFCSYCVIPYIRGNYRSVPKEEIIAEARQLASQGITEFVLVAQETTCYGIDIYGKKVLHELIHDLAAIDDIKWIRLLYAYPEEIYPELIDCFANEPKLVHYIDMPIQHCSDSILKAMGRKTSKADIINIVSQLRAAASDIAIRTTLICGFPGETDSDHKELLEFVEAMKFDRLGCFAYSQEDGTKAALFDNQIDDEIKQSRADEVMALQQRISLSNNELMPGKDIDVFIEGSIPEEEVYLGRSYKDAPGVDSFVFVKCNYELLSGTIVKVHINEFDEYDLIGEVVYEDEFT